MINLRIFFSSIVLLLMVNFASNAKGWRGIVPLRSNRSDVERLLGMPNGKYQRYEIKNEEATIIFSKGECVEGWKVPRDTVISITVTFKQSPKLSDLKLHGFIPSRRYCRWINASRHRL